MRAGPRASGTLAPEGVESAAADTRVRGYQACNFDLLLRVNPTDNAQ